MPSHQHRPPFLFVLLTTLATACADPAGKPLAGPPIIQRRHPAAATTGTTFDLTGNLFGDHAGVVLLGEQEAQVVEWTNNRIVATTPATATAMCGHVHVETSDHYRSNALPFAYGSNDLWIPWTEVPDGTGIAVWTGSEMILWSVSPRSGARYNPATDSWTRTTIAGAPDSNGKSVWTGKEMIVWGPDPDGRNAGGRYNPESDSWQTISLVNAPQNGIAFSMVWTGHEAITWGGFDVGHEGSTSGGRYDPLVNLWRPVAKDGSPKADLRRHSVIWSGSEMIIFGGQSGGNFSYASTQPPDDSPGYRYSPLNDQWRALSTHGAPSARVDHEAFWIGNRMLVWGGTTVVDSRNEILSSGSIYDPAADRWTAMSDTGAPQGLPSPSVVWTGSELLVWGARSVYDAHGNKSLTASGGRFDVRANAWRSMQLRGAPQPRLGAAAVWTGAELMIWGGHDTSGPSLRSGGRYDPKAEQWVPIATWDGEPVSGHPVGPIASTWTGNELIVWYWAHKSAANAGAKYSPVTNQWLPVSSGGAVPVDAGVWTGRDMIFVGGWNWSHAKGSTSVAKYDPAADQWAPLASLNEPRVSHKAVWTGNRVFVFGGTPPIPYANATSSGSIYDPTLNVWQPISQVNAPAGRIFPAAVWTGTGVMIFGGAESQFGTGFGAYLNSGGTYMPDEDRWETLPDGPEAIASSQGIWTGETVVLLGTDADSHTHRLLHYDLRTQVWSTVLLATDLSEYSSAALAWTGSEVITYFGPGPSGLTAFGYHPTSRVVRQLSRGCSSNTSRFKSHDKVAAVWTGEHLLVWTPAGGLTYFP